MCGRIALYSEPRAIAAMLGAGISIDDIERSSWHPSWNVGPTQPILAAADTASPEGLADRTLQLYRWGLITPWTRAPVFNVRSETVATKPYFRRRLGGHRLLIPADAFYEWGAGGAGRAGGRAGSGGAKQPKQAFAFRRADGQPMLLAGLSDVHHDGPDSWIRCATILTTAAGPDMAGIHHRMPVLVEADGWDHWLSPGVTDPEEVAAMLTPSVAGTLVSHPVGNAVGNIRNDGPELVERI